MPPPPRKFRRKRLEIDFRLLCLPDIVLRTRFTHEKGPFSRLVQQSRKSLVFRQTSPLLGWGLSGKIGGSGVPPLNSRLPCYKYSLFLDRSAEKT